MHLIPPGRTEWERGAAKGLSDAFGDVEQLTQLMLPAGLLVGLASDSVPEGLLLCDGRVVKKKSYPNLERAFKGKWQNGDEAEDELRLPSLTLAEGVLVGVTTGGLFAGSQKR